MTAGSDSVGTVMRTCLYHLLANPRTLESLRSELQGADLTLPFPRLSEIRDLSYLDACVQEASRLHPPFALPFERVTPKEGVEVLGVPLPGGTVVGGSPYVVNRHKEWFGDDAEVWRPERWLVDEENRKRLERGVLTVSSTPIPGNTSLTFPVVWCRSPGMSWEGPGSSRSQEADFLFGHEL